MYVIEVREKNEWEVIGKMTSRFWADRVAKIYGKDYADYRVIDEREPHIYDDNYFHAVQVGNNYSWDYGANDYVTAREMAEREIRNENNDGKQIRIAFINTDGNFCKDVTVIREGINE